MTRPRKHSTQNTAQRIPQTVHVPALDVTPRPAGPTGPAPDLKAELFRRVFVAESLVQLDVVEYLARALCSTLEVERIWRLMADRLPQLVDYSHLCLALYHEDSDAYIIDHTLVQDGSRPLTEGSELRAPEYGLRPPTEFREAVYEADVRRDDPAWSLDWCWYGIRSRVFAPIVMDGECLGVLILGSPEPAAFVPEEIEFLGSLTLYLAIALRNAMLYQKSQDALKELRATQHQLIQAEKQRVIGEMAAGIAHELNNSLGGVIGIAELVGLEVTDERQQALLTRLKQAALDAAETVRRINLFGRQKPGPEEGVATDLQHIAEGTITLTQYKWRNAACMEGRRVEVEAQFEDPGAVFGKPNELREVVTNLIMNAVDAMPEGGTVTLRTFCEGDQACLSIADTGTGIPPEELERIFDRHYTSKGEAGSGVGLSISRDIARAHGGELSVASVPGAGAVFTLRLPLRDGNSDVPSVGVT